MLRHIALFRFVPEITAEQVQDIADSLRALRAQIPELRDYRVGPGLGLREGSYDFAVVADFEDEAGWHAYVNHPAHQVVVHDKIGPLVIERASAQYEI